MDNPYAEAVYAAAKIIAGDLEEFLTYGRVVKVEFRHLVGEVAFIIYVGSGKKGKLTVRCRFTFLIVTVEIIIRVSLFLLKPSPPVREAWIEILTSFISKRLT